MIGKTFKVVIDGSAYGNNAKYCDPLYNAHIADPFSVYFNKKVYYIANKPLKKQVEGMVIAIANKGEPSEKLILAPLNTVYYSPEIRSRISRIRNQGPYHLKCLYEKSCGAIVFNDLSKERYFLVIKNTNGKYWGFPKGHIEVGETEEQTAIREVKEETNLDVTILDGFRKTNSYQIGKRINKKVVIFLAKTNSKNVKIQHDEVEKFKWLKRKDVYAALNHQNDLQIFKSAVAWLDKLNFKK